MRTASITLTSEDGSEELVGNARLPYTEAKALLAKLQAAPPKGAVAVNISPSDRVTKSYRLTPKPAAKPEKLAGKGKP